MMQAAERPRFRHQDLVAEPIDEQHGRFIDVMDPTSGNAFRFYEVEFSLACAMDGERDVAGLVQWAKAELGVTPSPNEVRSVIATLGEIGFLATAGGEQELAPGIVVGTQQRAEPPPDVELGDAGSLAAAGGATSLPPAPDLALGAPGASSGARAPKGPVEDVALGAPGRTAAAVPQVSEVSIDLSDHLSVKPDDVKEAVRASKVMSAVEVPKDLLDAIEEAKPAAKAPEKPPVPAARAPEKAPVPAARAPEKAPEKPRAPVELKQPVEKAPVAADKPVAPPSKISPVLIVLLILVVGGAAVYFGWRYLLRESSQDTTTTNEAVTAPVAPDPVPVAPTKPPDPTTKLTFASAEPREVVAIFAGKLESVEGGLEPKDVMQGDIIARLVGNKKVEKQIAALVRDEDRLKDELDKATKQHEKAVADNNAAAVKQWEKRMADRRASLEATQTELADRRDDLEQWIVRATIDGTVSAVAKPGQKLEESSIIAKITPAVAPTALFQLPKGYKFDVGQVVGLRSGETTILTCTVAESSPDGKLRVVCPKTPDAVEGAVVSLKLP